MEVREGGVEVTYVAGEALRLTRKDHPYKYNIITCMKCK